MRNLLFTLLLFPTIVCGQVGIVKSNWSTTTASPTTLTFTGGNTNGDSNVIGIIEGNSSALHVTAVTDDEGNSYTMVTSLTGNNFAQADWHSWWVAPVTHGGTANNVVHVTWNAGPSRIILNGAEASGVTTTSPFDKSANTTLNSSTSVNYTISPTVAGDLILTLNSRTTGGVNWSGLSGTDLFGVTNKINELNWFSGVVGSNTITATASAAGFGSTAIALKPSGSGGGPTTAQVIASGTVTLPTSSVSPGTCTLTTVAASSVLANDTITATFANDPNGISGYAPSITGSLFITSFATAGNVNFRSCNNNATAITPAAATLDWKVVR